MDSALLRDEAVQLAKSHGDAAVEPRHVLVALLRELGDRRPKELDQPFVTKLLGPAGSAWETPKPTEAAEARLAELAKAKPHEAVEIAKRVAAAPPGTGDGTGQGSGAATTGAGSAAVEHPPGDGATSA